MKNTILKVALTLLGIALIVFIYFISQPKIDSGIINIILVNDEVVEVINDEIEFSEYTDGKKTTLYAILEANYDIRVDNGFLYDFESVKTDGVDNFIKILKNDSFATKGIKTIDFKDQDVIKFVYTKVGDFS